MIIVPSYVLKVKLVNSYLDFFIGGYDNMSETKTEEEERETLLR